jgi:hypothetical protein
MGRTAAAATILSISAQVLFNTAAVYHVMTVLETTDMSNSVAAMNNGTSLANFESRVLLHEIGHALRLADISPTNGICSEVQSIMYSSGSVAFNCGVNSPTSCDATGINSVYPAAVSFCSTSQRNYCFVPSTSCQ